MGIRCNSYVYGDVEEGGYENIFARHEGIYHSQVIPGFWLRVEWLWQEPLPQTLDVLRELGLLQLCQGEAVMVLFAFNGNCVIIQLLNSEFGRCFPFSV